jgi:hypothetical protein
MKIKELIERVTEALRGAIEGGAGNTLPTRMKVVRGNVHGH